MASHTCEKQESRDYPPGVYGNWRPRLEAFLHDSSFKPIAVITVYQNPTTKICTVDVRYYARIKWASGIVVGILTAGISALVGIGTYTDFAVHAARFYDRLWYQFDAIARETGPPGSHGPLEHAVTHQTIQTYSSGVPVSMPYPPPHLSPMVGPAMPLRPPVPSQVVSQPITWA